eukprot:4901391-Prymnesium_polylepis.1
MQPHDSIWRSQHSKVAARESDMVECMPAELASPWASPAPTCRQEQEALHNNGAASHDAEACVDRGDAPADRPDELGTCADPENENAILIVTARTTS